ncbi:hypothetical protein IT087_02110 [Candidatus Uhrbacteria bacterium]|nr:hypothetical protein [Candidatus Uhrbacteria bacterium]
MESNGVLRRIEGSLHLEAFGTSAHEEECRKAAHALTDDGFAVFHDPRVDFERCKRFMRMMQRFFLLPDEERRACRRKEYYHQAGFTPQEAELPGAIAAKTTDRVVASIPESQKPTPVTGQDKKMRFMINIGPRPTEMTGKYPSLDGAPQVVPDGFPEWLEVAEPWGEQLRDAGILLLEMAMIGLGHHDHYRLFTEILERGYNLLAPTGSELTEDGVGPGTVFAGVHKDSSLLTVHPRATHPGLFAWDRTLRRRRIPVPDDCLLAQGGRQLEVISGGVFWRGPHEVVCFEDLMPLIDAARRAGTRVMRVASPAFLRTATGYVVCPAGPFRTPEALADPEYQPEESGERLMAGLRRRGLGCD